MLILEIQLSPIIVTLKAIILELQMKLYSVAKHPIVRKFPPLGVTSLKEALNAMES